MRHSLINVAFLLSAVTALDPGVTETVHGIAKQCSTKTTLLACNDFATEALASCGPEDLQCHCAQILSIGEFCGEACSSNTTTVIASSTFMNSKCSTVEWNPAAAGLLDRILFRHNDEEDDEEDYECDNGNDEDDGSTWYATGMTGLRRRETEVTEEASNNIFPDSETETDSSDASEADAETDSSGTKSKTGLSFRNRFMVHGQPQLYKAQQQAQRARNSISAKLKPLTAAVVQKAEFMKIHKNSAPEEQEDIADSGDDQDTTEIISDETAANEAALDTVNLAVDCCTDEATRSKMIRKILESAGNVDAKLRQKISASMEPEGEIIAAAAVDDVENAIAIEEDDDECPNGTAEWDESTQSYRLQDENGNFIDYPHGDEEELAAADEVVAAAAATVTEEPVVVTTSTSEPALATISSFVTTTTTIASHNGTRTHSSRRSSHASRSYRATTSPGGVHMAMLNLAATSGRTNSTSKNGTVSAQSATSLNATQTTSHKLVSGASNMCASAALGIVMVAIALLA